MRKASKPWLLVIDSSGYGEVWAAPTEKENLRRMIFAGNQEDAALIANASLEGTSVSLMYEYTKVVVRPIAYVNVDGWKLRCRDMGGNIRLFDVQRINDWKGV